MAEDDRPREKFLKNGPATLSDSELLAILIRSGTKSQSAVDLCKHILQLYDNNIAKLSRMSVLELSKFKGIGKVKAITILVALELGRRRQKADINNLSKITCSKNAFDLIGPDLSDKSEEEFWVLYLNQANKINAKEFLSKGGITGTVVDQRLLFRNALGHKAVSVILIHNHPSGNCQPSEADKTLTRKMKEAGQLLEIKVLDHIIIAGNNYYSFADEGIM